MDKKKAPENGPEVLQVLHEFLVGPEPDYGSLPIEDVRAELSKQKIDSVAAAKSVQRRIAEAKALAKRSAATRKVHSAPKKGTISRKNAKNAVKKAALASAFPYT